MNMLKAVRYIGDRLQKYGVLATLHDLQCRLVNTAAHFQILRGMTVRMRNVRDPSLYEAPGFDARFLKEGELWIYAQDPAHQISPEFLGVALERGDRCYGLIDRRGGALAAYGWYSNLRTPLDEHFLLHFERSWSYMYKGYTMPAYRGMRLHAIGMCRALRELRHEGRKGLISCVASNNHASLQSVTRMGYRIFGSAYLLRVGERSYAHATRGCKRYGFRVEPFAAPREPTAVRGFSKP